MGLQPILFKQSRIDTVSINDRSRGRYGTITALISRMTEVDSIATREKLAASLASLVNQTAAELEQIYENKRTMGPDHADRWAKAIKAQIDSMIRLYPDLPADVPQQVPDAVTKLKDLQGKFDISRLVS